MHYAGKNFHIAYIHPTHEKLKTHFDKTHLDKTTPPLPSSCGRKAKTWTSGWGASPIHSLTDKLKRWQEKRAANGRRRISSPLSPQSKWWRHHRNSNTIDQMQLEIGASGAAQSENTLDQIIWLGFSVPKNANSKRILIKTQNPGISVYKNSIFAENRDPCCELDSWYAGLSRKKAKARKVNSVSVKMLSSQLGNPSKTT